MEFFLSIYNVPALVLLAYLCWVRPVEGTIVALLAGLRVLGPIAGIEQWIPFSVHMTLVGVSLIPSRRPGGQNPLLIGGALGVGLFTSYFYLLLWNEPLT